MVNRIRMRAVYTALICFLAHGLIAQEGIEYWFGTDPGAGNGTFIEQGSGDGASLALAGLPRGSAQGQRLDPTALRRRWSFSPGLADSGTV